jgi:hypothetical protein
LKRVQRDSVTRRSFLFDDRAKPRYVRSKLFQVAGEVAKAQHDDRSSSQRLSYMRLVYISVDAALRAGEDQRCGLLRHERIHINHGDARSPLPHRALRLTS